MPGIHGDRYRGHGGLAHGQDRLLHFGTISDYISTAARHCKRLIVEVNPQMPRGFCESLLHISEVDAIVENDVPLLETVPRAPKPEAEAIGRLIAAEIPDGATLQLGSAAFPMPFASSWKATGI